MKIIGGPASQLLASRVAAQLGLLPVPCEFKTFPDNEKYIRVLDPVDSDAIIIQSTVKDSDFVALLQLIDICSTADRVHVVIPYMGYARQNRVFNPGEALSARAMARSIEADNVIVVNIHEESVLDHFRCDTIHLDAAPSMGKYINEMNMKDPIILAPDRGAKELAASAAAEIGIDYDHLEKKRISGDTVQLAPKKLPVKDREVLIIDDIVATGGTIAEAVRLLGQQGAAGVHVACIHPVLSGSALIKLFHAGVKDVISTDTIEKAVSRVSVAPLIARTLKEII